MKELKPERAPLPECWFFDMDHTLIGADCDVTWKEFAVEHGLAPASALEEAERFFEDYNAGTMDVDAFLRFQLREFAGRSVEEVDELSRLHFRERILPHVYDDAMALVAELRDRGARLGILTSTNDRLARPVADYFGISLLAGTRLETEDGRCTGRIAGIYGAGAGKVRILRTLADDMKIPLSRFAYYGDSINDRDILEAVGFPHAVNPSGALRRVAEAAGWPVLNWK